jgi:carboxymethylenebutenolidase
MSHAQVRIATADGECPAHVFRPGNDKGPWPAVLFFMDGIGIRPALFEMGERMASHGYFVLLPDLYYRAGAYEPMNAKKVFSDPDMRAMLMSKFMSAISQEKVKSDAKSFLEFLSAQSDVVQSAIGTTGYCMGGSYSLATAGNYPDRVVAAASYHGGRLATDAPDSPHLLAPKIKARVYVAGAIEDQSFPDDMKARLVAALTEAKVDNVVETYDGAKHGWVPTDTPSYSAEAAERHWKTLIALFDATLKKKG